MADLGDTDVLLAMVSSLLNAPATNQAIILDALVQSEGNVERAAQLLNSPHKRGLALSHPKQKPKSRLDEWLQPTQTSSMRRKRLRSASPVPTQPCKVKPRSSLGVDSPIGDFSSPGPSSSKGKAISNEDFLNMLRSPSSSDTHARVSPPKFPPLTLSTPTLVAKHTPCTMHTNVLPQELACRLFYTMMEESETWQRNKWFLFERMVESPHKTSFYVRDPAKDDHGHKDMNEATRFWYNGRNADRPRIFSSPMVEACDYIERVVSTELRKRQRFPLEWGGEPPEVGETTGDKDKILWRANVAASNRYEGSNESVGYHTDALTFLGPYPTIASLSLGTTRTFRLREVIPTDEKEARSARTYNIPVTHNSLLIMHAPCQETFKHCVPQRTIDPFRPAFPPPSHEGQSTPEIKSYNTRINITFRFFRPDYAPSTIPRCRCDEPCILRPDMKHRSDFGATEESNSQLSQEPLHQGANPKSENPSIKPASHKKIVEKYWWLCNAGAQNEGKTCGLWSVMDAKAEGRGPFVGDV